MRRALVVVLALAAACAGRVPLEDAGEVVYPGPPEVPDAGCLRDCRPADYGCEYVDNLCGGLVMCRNTCADFNASCGSVEDGCGGQVYCGGC